MCFLRDARRGRVSLPRRPSGNRETQVDREVSPAERELGLEEYHVMFGTFDDYRDLIIIYGYTVLFVAAFPLAPLMALVNAYAQIRVDAFRWEPGGRGSSRRRPRRASRGSRPRPPRIPRRVSRGSRPGRPPRNPRIGISVSSRRPWPENAEDIGSWADIIELMSYIAVFTNSVIIVYTGEFLEYMEDQTRIVVFIVLYHMLIFFKLITAIVIEDVPADVQIQIDRQAIGRVF